jgi:hypothetical protein
MGPRAFFGGEGAFPYPYTLFLRYDLLPAPEVRRGMGIIMIMT